MSKQRTYTGHSGQLAVLAELLSWQCNVAVPQVDWGLDTFAFLDEEEAVTRLQIKTANGKAYKSQPGYSAQFDLPMKQLEAPDTPPLFYVLVARHRMQFADFLVLARKEVQGFLAGSQPFGTENEKSGNLVLTIRFRPMEVLCGGVDLAPYRNAWERLPPLRPKAGVSVEKDQAAEG
jgi:hypothetical protein